MFPPMHAALVSFSAVTALISAGILLATHPRSATARVHAVYGGTAAWWLVTMAMGASAETAERAQVWARLAQVGIGMLPGVAFHVNVAHTGLAVEYRRAIHVHYVLSLAVTLFCLSWPGLLAEPHLFTWGYYLSYTAWGAIPLTLLLVTFVEVTLIYRQAMRNIRRRARDTNPCARSITEIFSPTWPRPIFYPPSVCRSTRSDTRSSASCTWAPCSARFAFS